MSDDAAVETTQSEGGEPVGAEAVFNLSELLGGSGDDADGTGKGTEQEKQEPEKSIEPDDEILKAFEEQESPGAWAGEEATEDKAKEEPKEKEKQGKDVEKQAEEAEPSLAVNLPPELLADALYSPEALGHALNEVANHIGKYMENYAARLADYLRDQVQRAMVTTEVMLYLHDAAKETPEILEYPNVMRRLMQKYVGQGPSNEIVRNAVNEFKAAYQKYAAMKANGNKIVDVRSQKTPPKPPRTSVSSASADQPGDVNNLGYLATVLNKTFKKE